MIKIAGNNKGHVIPPKLPIVQKVKPRSSESVLIKVRIPIPTEAIALIAIPTRSIYVTP